MKKLILLVVLVLLSASICAEAKVVIVTGDWPPYTSEKMEGYGFLSKIVSAAFKEAGIEIEYQFYPWLRCEKNIKEGKAYAAFPYIITDERKAIYDFSDPLGKSSFKFFYLKSNVKSDVVWEKYEDLKKYKVGGTAGYWYEKTLTDAGIKLDLAVSDELGVKNFKPAGLIFLLLMN